MDPPQLACRCATRKPRTEAGVVAKAAAVASDGAHRFIERPVPLQAGHGARVAPHVVADVVDLACNVPDLHIVDHADETLSVGLAIADPQLVQAGNRVTDRTGAEVGMHQAPVGVGTHRTLVVGDRDVSPFMERGDVPGADPVPARVGIGERPEDLTPLGPRDLILAFAIHDDAEDVLDRPDPGLDREGGGHLQRRVGAGVDERTTVEVKRVAVVRLRCDRPQDRRGVLAEHHVGAVGLNRCEAERFGIVERRIDHAGVVDPEPDPGAVGNEGHHVRVEELCRQRVGNRRVQIDDQVGQRGVAGGGGSRKREVEEQWAAEAGPGDLEACRQILGKPPVQRRRTRHIHSEAGREQADRGAERRSDVRVIGTQGELATDHGKLHRIGGEPVADQ